MAAQKKKSPSKTPNVKSRASVPTAPARAKSAQATKPAAAAKPSKASKASKASKTAKASAPAKRADEPKKPVKPVAAAAPAKTSIKDKVKRAVAKVTQAAAAAAVQVLDSDVGRAAPSFELSDENGKAISSSALSGKPYLLYFYPKDDTPGCTREACDIRDNFARFGKQGLRVLGVSPDSTQSHAKFGKKYGLPFTLLSDPEKSLASAYGVWGKKQNYGKEYMGIIRSSFLVGADGKIKKAYRGVKVDGHVSQVLEDAKALL